VSLRVRIAEPATASSVNAALVGAGVAVSALVPERASLEEAFLSLVGEAPVAPEALGASEASEARDVRR